jgi:hypothetical protein
MTEYGGLERYRALAQLLDAALRIPGTNWRFGIDPLLGLVPGLGDALGALLGAYGILVARRLGAPAAIQGHMLLNLSFDLVAGIVPVVGDALDFAFRSNRRNLALLERWLAAPHATRRQSRLTLAAIAAALALCIAAGAAAGFYLLRAGARLLGV